MTKDNVINNIPYSRNDFFAGRDDVLALLHDTLMADQMMPLTLAITGLGGIGKTQIAVEYAYRYQSSYQIILWVSAASLEQLLSGFIAIANQLDLLEKSNQNRVVAAVKRWLREHAGWLLIVDDVDDLLDFASEFLPTAYRGHILLTTRARASGILAAQSIQIEQMQSDEGALFLLRRTGTILLDIPLHDVAEDKQIAAKELSEILGGLPLALDQAGAYIKEMGCSISDYLSLYQNQQLQLLREHGVSDTRDYPLSVATTWSLSFERVAKAYPLAIELLRFCAFLSPEPIPEEIIMKGGLDRESFVQSARSEMRSLLSMLPSDNFDLVAIFHLPPEDLSQWVLDFCQKHSPVHDIALSPQDLILLQEIFAPMLSDLRDLFLKVLGDDLDMSAILRWPPKDLSQIALDFFQKYLPLFKVILSPQDFIFLQEIVGGFTKRLNDPEIEATFQSLSPGINFAFSPLSMLKAMPGEVIVDELSKADARSRPIASNDFVLDGEFKAILRFSLAQRHPGSKMLTMHPLVQAVLRAELDEEMQRQWSERTVRTVGHVFEFVDAEFKTWPLFQRCLPHVQTCATLIKQWNIASFDAAELLRKFGGYLRQQGRYMQAEQYLRQSVALCESLLGSNFTDPYSMVLFSSLDELASVYDEQGRYVEAELLYLRTQSFTEQMFGQTHRSTPTCLNDLAVLYRHQGKYEQSEQFSERALALFEHILGPMHPAVTWALNNLAWSYYHQGKYEQVEPLLQRALTIDVQAYGEDHPEVASDLDSLARFYYYQGKYEQAESLLLQAQALRERHLGSTHAYTATTLENMADLYREQGKYEQAEQFYERALAIYDQTLKAKHPNIAHILNGIANLHCKQGKYEQAESLYQRALHIYEQSLGSEHPDVAYPLHDWANFYREQGKHEQAEPLYQQALRIREHALGEQHPLTKKICEDYPALVRKTAEGPGAIQSASPSPPRFPSNDGYSKISYASVERTKSMANNINESEIFYPALPLEDSILAQRGRDLTYEAAQGKILSVYGRERETRQIIEILRRRVRRNPILVGEAGVGKTAIVESLALAIVQRQAPNWLQNKKIVAIGLFDIIAQGQYWAFGEYAQRVKDMVEALRTKPKEEAEGKGRIAFFDEMHTFTQYLHGSSYLRQYLARGEIQLIGATTIDEYRQYIERDPALERRFAPVLIEEPSDDTTIYILKQLRPHLEKHYHVNISDSAIKLAVELSHRYIHERHQPDKSIELIDRASVRVLSLGFDSNLEIKEQLPTIHQQGSDPTTNLIPLTVEEEHIRTIVAEWTGMPDSSLSGERQKYLELESELKKRIVGQNGAISQVTRTILANKAGTVVKRQRPNGVFLFAGPTGVGKTELAKTLAFLLTGKEEHLVVLDMTGYREGSAVTSLIGVPRGNYSTPELPLLTKLVRGHPFGVLLLDDIEKAHPELLSLFLPVFEEGKLVDRQGTTIHFSNMVIIMTVNVDVINETSERFQNELSISSQEGTRIETKIWKDIYSEEILRVVNHDLMFPRRFLNQLDELIIFYPLEQSFIKDILKMQLAEMEHRLNLKLNLTPEAFEFLARAGYDPKYGAKGLRRSLDQYIGSPLGIMMLKAEINAHAERLTINIDINADWTGLKLESSHALD
jgi:ATP-dependent Clp protease ATP-binding subunit ClpC